METKPPVQYSELSKNIIKRSGIVNLSRHDDSHILWFSKPKILMSLISGLTFILVLLSLAAIAGLTGRLGMRFAAMAYLPVMVFGGAVLFKLNKNNKYIEFKNDKLIYMESRAGMDTIVQEIDRKAIYSVSSEFASPTAKMAPPYPMYPEILICAEPRNASIAGPRRFRHTEMEFIVSVINDFSIGKL